MQHGILYQFPRVATIKFHKLDDLKQQKFIVSEFQRPAVQNQSLAAPLKTSETQRGKSFPASFQFLMVTISSWHSLASNCITPLSAYVITCNSLCVSLSVTAFHSYKAIRLTGCVCVCVCVCVCGCTCTCTCVHARVLAAQSCPTICNLLDYSPPGSSVHRIFQERVLEGQPFLSPGDLPNPGIKPGSSAFQFNMTSS